MKKEDFIAEAMIFLKFEDTKKELTKKDRRQIANDVYERDKSIIQGMDDTRSYGNFEGLLV